MRYLELLVMYDSHTKLSRQQLLDEVTRQGSSFDDLYDLILFCFDCCDLLIVPTTNSNGYPYMLISRLSDEQAVELQLKSENIVQWTSKPLNPLIAL